ncbi:DivIVA domain-containing protein [Facklamia hominis]
MDKISEISTALFGYNRQQVSQLVEHRDQKIKELENQLLQMQQKIQTLEKDLSYYQSIEAALKDGLVDARKTGNEIISHSQEQADQLLERTNEQIIQFKENLAHYSQELADTGLDLKDRLKTMQSQMIEMMEEQVQYLKAQDFERVYPDKQIDRFLNQVDYYREEDRLSVITKEVRPNKDPLTQDEKATLQRLVQEVIKNETEHLKQEDDKLLHFKQG